MTKINFSDLIKFEDENFTTKIEQDTDGYRPVWMLKVTHNGHQWSTIGLNTIKEIKQVINVLEEIVFEAEQTEWMESENYGC